MHTLFDLAVNIRLKPPYFHLETAWLLIVTIPKCTRCGNRSVDATKAAMNITQPFSSHTRGDELINQVEPVLRPTFVVSRETPRNIQCRHMIPSRPLQAEAHGCFTGSVILVVESPPGQAHHGRHQTLADLRWKAPADRCLVLPPHLYKEKKNINDNNFMN